ncbi:MAG TPA: roadblock/LC7 domain-containing protein [Gemmatimonadales bacterium]|nr:roadblock/LC7 domain-containing protein [Gemmatimonadales bacterium]
MRSIEPWVNAPLDRFLMESSARVALLMTSSGQVVAQHGFTRSIDVMTAAALGAGIVASTDELARQLGSRRFGSLVHQGTRQQVFLAAFDLPRGRWIGLVVFDGDSTVGLVQLFFDRLVAELAALAPPATTGGPRPLPETFERDLNASLRALFGR